MASGAGSSDEFKERGIPGYRSKCHSNCNLQDQQRQQRQHEEHNQQQQQQKQQERQQQQQKQQEKQQGGQHEQHEQQQQQQCQGQKQPQLWYTPSSFCTPAQLLHVRSDIFLTLQAKFKSSSSNLSLHPAHEVMRQYSAVVGLTSQPHLLPFVFSGPDPLAPSVLSSIVGQSLPCGSAEVVLLDRLDLAECLGVPLMMRSGVGGDVMVDVSVVSLLEEACTVAELGLQSVQSLFQTVVYDTVPVCLVPSESPVQIIHPHAIPSEPIPFQRVVDILQQHLYWIPTSQLSMLLRQHGQHSVETSHTHFLCGFGGKVECFTLPSLPLQDLLRWYQMELVRRLSLPQDELMSDMHRTLENVLS